MGFSPYGSAAYACALAERRPKHLVLILAREFASNLATPALIANEAGRLVFFNEAAEALFGRPFAGVGEVPIDEFTASIRPRTRDSEPLPPERRPARRANHETFMITSADGIDREISVTGVPLFAHADEFVGVMTIFWRE